VAVHRSDVVGTVAYVRELEASGSDSVSCDTISNGLQ